MNKNPCVTITGRELSVKYAHFEAFSAKNLKISGNVIAVIGHNGAGKSTFIKTILGLLTPTKGTFAVMHNEGNELTALKPDQHMAFCPENGSVFADISVERYLELWCRIRHHNPRYYLTTGIDYVELLDIAPLLKRKGRELSKGQRRRVQTALGFMLDPKLFLVDEPFDGLDVSRTNQLMEIVEAEKEKRCFIVSSHRMDVVERISDTVAVLRKGEIQAIGNVSEVCTALLGNGTNGTLTDAMRVALQSVEGF